MLRFSRASGQPGPIVLGDRARNAHQWDVAAQHYRTALARNPFNPPIWVQFGHALKEAGSHVAAETAYRRAIAGDPTVADSYLQLGHVLKLQGRTEEAKAAYVHALSTDRSLHAAAVELAALGCSAEDLPQLMREIPAPVAVDNGLATRSRRKRWRESIITRADRARDLGQWDIAARYYRVALDRNPRNPLIWVQFGHALKESGNLAEAEAAYRRALSYEPRVADFHLQLGHVLKLQGKTEAAESAYLRAFALGTSSHPPSELRQLGWDEIGLSELRGMLEEPTTASGGELMVPRQSEVPGRQALLNRAVAEEKGLATAATIRPCRLTISLLTFGTFDQCAALLPDLCALLSDNESLSSLQISIVVRNNNPRLDSTLFDRLWQELIDKYRGFHFVLFEDGLNVGFGKGHNLNFDALPCDYFLVLNDDISFKGIGWLATALTILENDAVAAAVGAATNPGSITPFYANGTWNREWHRWPLRYVEGSVMLLRASVFAQVGKFDPAYEWVYCEDGDLSFRIQALGYRLEWIDIPHDHRRGSSFNVLPSQVKGSLLEHNRSVVFSKWSTSISQNRIGRFQIYDLWSDGIGDIFIGLLHLKTYLSGLNETQRSIIIVNTSAPDVARLILGDDIIIQSESDLHRLAASYAELGVRNLSSLRGLNYALPFNIHALVCAALAIPVATRDNLSSVLNNRSRQPGTHPPPTLPQGPYCVVHLESERADHDGKAPSPATTALIASLAAEIFPRLVFVGRTKHLAVDDIPASRVIDLRGQLSISGLIDVISGADSFVGLESFPAHIAQVAKVKSVVFCGSNHPLFRALSPRQTWPIVKPLDCIGCYHTLLEPTIPYCMRRDLSCTKDIPASEIRMVMESCAALEAFDWRVLEMRALALQQKFLMTMFFHPDPQRRFLNVQGTPQLATTGLIERVIEQVREHLLTVGGYESMASSIEQLDGAMSEVHRKDVEIASMVKLIAELRGVRDVRRPADGHRSSP